MPQEKDNRHLTENKGSKFTFDRKQVKLEKKKNFCDVNSLVSFTKQLHGV